MFNSGNHVVDYHDRMETKLYECRACEGTGHVEWTDMEKMFDELAFIAYKKGKEGNPLKSFKECLALARKIRARGQECRHCDGTGEVYV
jgi:hypothetical protein